MYILQPLSSRLLFGHLLTRLVLRHKLAIMCDKRAHLWGQAQLLLHFILSGSTCTPIITRIFLLRPVLTTSFFVAWFRQGARALRSPP